MTKRRQELGRDSGVELSEAWAVVQQRRPVGWEEMARELGAF